MLLLSECLWKFDCTPKMISYCSFFDNDKWLPSISMKKNTSITNLFVPVWPVMSLNPLKILKAAARCKIIYIKGKMILQEWWWFLNRLSVQKQYICAGVCILGRYYIGVHFWHGDYVNGNDVTFSITNGPDGAQVSYITPARGILETTCSHL